MELEALQEQLDEFKSYGASIVALCPQRVEFNQSIVDELALKYPVLQDRNNLVASAFGLSLPTPPDVIEAEQFLGLDLPAHNGTDNWDLPIPTRYVIDRRGLIRYASFHVDHRMRNNPQECLDILKTELKD